MVNAASGSAGGAWYEGPIHHAIERRGHPTKDGMAEVALDIRYHGAGVALIPGPVERLGGDAELRDEIVREVLRLDLAALFAPKANKGGFIGTHDDAGVRAAD